MSKTHYGGQPLTYSHALRVTLSFASGRISELKATRIAMRVPATLETPPPENGAGYWFEVRDAGGRLLYCRPLPHGDPGSIEVFDDPEGGGIRRVPVARRETKVDLLVPDFPEAAEFTLHGPERPADRRKASAVLGRRPMDQLRQIARDESTPAKGGVK